jgi:hypothetical protein
LRYFCALFSFYKYKIMEYIALILLVATQIFVFLRTRKHISNLEQAFPSDGYQSLRLTVADDDLLSGQIDSVLASVAAGKMPDTHFMLSQTAVTMIRTNRPKDSFFGNIVYLINKYVLRSRSVAPSIESLERLVEREYEYLRTQVENTLNTPLYIGLLGTIGGIVFGLWKVDLKGDLSNIEMLLSGVFIAMIGSFAGLLLTTLNTAQAYPKAQNTALTNKNRFFNFLQTDLLPSATGSDLASVVMNMQKNLDLFNSKFKDNLVEFDKSMSSVFENTKVQRDFLARLQEVDYQKIVNGNIEIFSKMQGVVDNFDKFAEYITKLNTNLAIANELSGKMDKLFTRADEAGMSFGKVATQIDARLENSNQLMAFLRSHFAELDDRKAILAKALINFDDFLQKSFTELERTTVARSAAIKDNVMQQEDLMLKAFEGNRQHLTQLENLKTIREHTELLYQQTVALRNSLGNVETQLQNATLQIQSATNEQNPNNIFAKIKKMFG